MSDTPHAAPRTVAVTGGGAVVRTRAGVALALVAWLAGCAPSRGAPRTLLAAYPPRGVGEDAGVLPGVEVLLRDSLHLVRGRRVGLITNPTGRDRAGTSTADLLARAPGVRLTALFGPEHGIRGTAAAGAHVASSVDSATGVPVYSLYGATRAPTREMLRDVDVLVYDIQDVGARVYTFEWTMALAAAAADSAGIPFVVLDRPDPVRADRVEGGVLDPRFASFVGQYPVAMRYGLTPGELLRYLAGTGKVRVSHLSVVPMRGYRRAMWYADTRLPRVNPSPNLRSTDAELLYTGTVLFEGTNVSEGRGTDEPFALVGAPWLADAPALAGALNARVARDAALRGVRFEAVTRAVAAGTEKFGGQTIPMLRVIVTDRDHVRPDAVGLWMLRTIYAAHPREFAWRTAHADRLAGSDRMRTAVEAGDGAVADLLARYAEEGRAFAGDAARFWIYR